MSDLPATPEVLDLSAAFLEIAACPQCHSKFALDYDLGELVCSSPDCGLAFPVHDGVPDLRIDAARRPADEVPDPAPSTGSTGSDRAGSDSTGSDSTGTDADQGEADR